MSNFKTPMTTAAVLSGLLAFAAPAHAQPRDIHTTYSTQKGACGQGDAHRVTISQGLITGPDFECRISDGTPAGSGLEAYSGVCTVAGAKVSDSVALDLGNYADHFALSIPNRDEWIDLYPCTKVPGLE